MQDDEDFCMPTFDQFVNLCKSFKKNTAIGACNYSPRHFAFLSERGYKALICIVWAVLRLAVVPTQLDMLFIWLIPKPMGGERPIGVFPAPLRILSRWVRRTYGVRWADEHGRPYFFSVAGAPATVCAWRTAAITEFVGMTGKAVWIALLDLVKAFEKVGHNYLQAASERFNFNPVLLKFLLMTYRLKRRVRIGRVVVVEARASKSIVPGDAFSDYSYECCLCGL